MSQQLPAGAKKVADIYPEIWDAYGKLGEACATSGPLDAKTLRLAKLALAIGAGSEGAVHSHAWRALETTGEDVDACYAISRGWRTRICGVRCCCGSAYGC